MVAVRVACRFVAACVGSRGFMGFRPSRRFVLPSRRMVDGRDRNEGTPGACGPREGWPPLLTAAQLRIVAELQDYVVEHGFSPTQRELGRRVGWSSRGSLWQYLEQLRALGVIEGSGRAMRVVDRSGRR